MTRMHRTVALMLALLLQACALPSTYSYKEIAMPESVKLSPRLQKIFAKTKLVCFGRYALEVPQETELVWGSAAFPASIEIIRGGIDAVNQRLAKDVAKIRKGSKTAEIMYSQAGPVTGSWQIRFYEDAAAKRFGLLDIRTYINKGDITFITGWTVSDDNIDSSVAEQAYIAKNVRLRSPDEIPDEPGYCIEHGFIPDNRYADQEMANAGIYLPSLPDINFSVSSNKNAYADYGNDYSYKPRLSLLYRIEEAKKDQGIFYPSRAVLREGKRDVQQWHGEESLIRRKDGTHDFEWALVGTPKDIANPSVLGAVMYSKVEHNTVGAAKEASVTDDEAVALWDKLLSGLKFRVKVPGAPEGAYYTNPSKPISPPPPLVWYPGQLCPKDGYYKLAVDDPNFPFQGYLQNLHPMPERAGSVFDRFSVAPEYLGKAKMVWVRDLDENGHKYSRKRTPS